MKIERLSTSVVNRIAAGEIIHHPYNAVKEMTENSLDAGSTYIQIELINSSLGSIKIIDNGRGIKMDDMPLVCERYATSKLKEFKDLLKLETFGFRGEALSSISQISNVIIVSKPRDNPYGYQKKALRSPTEERRHILDVIKKYAIHNPTVRFTLKKDNSTEMSTQATLSTLDRIQQVYGASVSSCLKTIEYADSRCQFKIMSSDPSDPNYGRHNKKAYRLIDNNKIKKEMKLVYTGITNGINPPFIYVSLKVEPSHVDVRLLNEDEITDKITTALSANISSPTRKKKAAPVPLPEKATLNHYFKPAPVNQTPSTETDSSSSVLGTPPPSLKEPKKGKINHYFKNVRAEKETPAANNHRNGNGLSYPRALPINFQNTGMDEKSGPRQRTPPTSSTMASGVRKFATPYQRISSTPLQPVDTNLTPEISVSYLSKPLQKEVAKRLVGVNLRKSNPVAPIATKASPVPTKAAETTFATKETTPPVTEKPNLEQENLQELDSMVTIKSDIELAEDKSLSKIFTRNQCVGIIDDVLVLLSYKARFYLVNYNTISEEYFYQLVLYNLGKFGKLFLSSSIPIKPCISLFIPNATHRELDNMIDSLLCYKDLLQSYYNIEIALCSDNNTVQLVCLPMLLVNHTPSFDKLPIFLHNIATQIEWGNEIDCLDAIAREISSFYCCCSKNQCTSFLQSARDGNFKAPRYLSEKGYITELDFPDEILA
ncbi:hypothetical protein HPULCUR_006471 [Helicostylum pulchrum]|uniref:DNA mismatch repair protein S5 domain-containing protein n=1 Tax=Helicostylum pulchrum TaxID=562976 RepID=A0ABP9Y213_9FUNG